MLARQTLLNNRYSIGNILGQGGMASVYRAIDQNLGVEVAVKENLFTTEEYARQFRLEATILASLRHPNMPRVTDHFVIDGQGQYLVMDYIEGEDLRQRMDRVGVLQDEEVIVIGVAMCEALSYLHSRSPIVLHRDIKPSNVKIDPNGQIFLVDFGLAKVMQGGEATTSGARAMTPGYSPPEQYGTARTDHRSDIYSLGATLYSALTDSLPEDGLARAMEQTTLTPIREHNPNVSRRLAAVIEKALEVLPDNRYQSAEDFRQSLLSARSSSRQKAPVELLLEPPPAAALQDEFDGQGNLPPERKSSLVGGIFISEAEPASPSKGLRKFKRKLTLRQKSARRNLWVGVSILGTLFLIAVLTYRSWQPGLNGFSLTFSPASSSTLTLTAAPTYPTATAPRLEPSTQAAVLVNHTPTPTSAPAQISSPTPRRTSLPTRTPSPVPLPTPLGGGVPQIAFASDRSGIPEIFIMKIDGSEIYKLTDFQEGACQPAWSPDGSQLVFISPCPKVADTYPGSSLFIINADGSGLTPLPTIPGGDYDPVWSPDGKRILFTSLRNNSIPQIFIMDLETRQVTLLPDPDSRDNYQGSWSPDGKQIVYVGPRSQIWVMDADGSNRFLISRPSENLTRNPRWSPDGQTVVFTQFVENKPAWLATVKPELGALTVNMSQDQPMAKAAYSPDGFWLVFQSRQDGSTRDIFIMTANGVGRQRLTSDPWNNFDAAWRPAK